MPMHRWNGTTWTPAKTLPIWDGSDWIRSKKVKVWTSANEWVLAWVHPVTNASLSLSKTGIISGETYNVVLTAPLGFPEGAAVTFRFTGYSYTVYPTEGDTTATLVGASHVAGGSYQWYADVTTKGGNTSFGPVSQNVDVPATTVTLTAPPWVLSTQSGSGGASSIAARTFTIDLSNPAIVSRVSFQLSHQGGAWTEYAGWNNPAAQVSHTMTFFTPGAWQARAVVTQNNALVVYSSAVSVPCYIKHLGAAATPASPVVGDSVSMNAWHSGDALGAVSGRWQYMYTSVGTWVDNWSAANPAAWQATGVNDIQWRWAETFADGSWIISNTVRTIISPAPITHYHEVVPSGSSRAAIQNAMDRAYNHFMANQTGTAVNFDSEATMACVELVANGTYTLDGTALFPRRGVRLIGGGSGASRPRVYGDTASHLFKNDNNGGGLYKNPHYDWLVQNIRFDCNNRIGGFSIVHTRRFRIRDCDFANMGGAKHYIEVNSSGNTRSDGTYNVEIMGCYFTMANTSPANAARRTLDECIQLDYSWDGSAANSYNDGTVTNNVKIESCTFYRVPRAIGGHRYNAETGNGDPKGMHANVLITGCQFTEVSPVDYGAGATNGAGSEGAVRAYMWSNVHILSSTFTSCFQPICLYIPADAVGSADPTYYRIASNVISGKTSTRPGIVSTSGHASRVHQQVLVESNTVNGSWGGTDYFVAMEDTGTQTLPASAETVVIRNNRFEPSNMTAAEEKAYNKYRAKGANNAGSVWINSNTVSDGSVSNA